MLNEDLLKKALELYTGKHVLERVLELKDNAFVREGEIVQGTIYNQTINNFSDITEPLSTDSYLQLISNYLDVSLEAINNNKGTINSISDDLIISYWNNKLLNDDASMACEAALTSVENNLKTSPVKSLNLSIGIHTSNFILGNFGSKYRLVHTIIGDSLSLVDRLSNANKYYGTNIIITDAVKNKLNTNFIYRELDKLIVIGKDDPIVVYELYGYANKVNKEQMKMLQLFDDGLNEYKNYNWGDAIKIFNNIIENFDNDGPSKTYWERCNEFLKNPPPKKWNGGIIIK